MRMLTRLRTAVAAAIEALGFSVTTAPALAARAGDKWLAKHSAFSLHAGVAAAARKRDKVERPCRCIARPSGIRR